MHRQRTATIYHLPAQGRDNLWTQVANHLDVPAQASRISRRPWHWLNERARRFDSQAHNRPGNSFPKQGVS